MIRRLQTRQIVEAAHSGYEIGNLLFANRSSKSLVQMDVAGEMQVRLNIGFTAGLVDLL